MRVTYLPRFREAGPQRLRVRVDAADRTHDQPRRALGGGRGAARRERRCALRRGARLVVVVGRRRGRRGAGEVAGRGAARRRARGAPPLRRRLEPRSTRRQMDLKRRRGPRAIRRVGARKDESFPLRISSVDSLSLSLSGRQAQPPCAYYEAAFRAGAFKRLVVVSEDAANPCGESLRASLNATLRLGGSLRDDADLLRTAAHLALSASLFPASLAMHNTRLKSLHVPFGFSTLSFTLTQHKPRAVFSFDTTRQYIPLSFCWVFEWGGFRGFFRPVARAWIAQETSRIDGTYGLPLAGARLRCRTRSTSTASPDSDTRRPPTCASIRSAKSSAASSSQQEATTDF